VLEGSRDGELDIRERMLLTFDLKRSMKPLHCSSVASVEEDGCGFTAGQFMDSEARVSAASFRGTPSCLFSLAHV